MKPRAGFSIIELLAVIGVVCVLIGLFLPALQRARAGARTVTVASNMRQLGLLIVAYGSDHRDLPPVLFKPIETYIPQDPWQEVMIGDVVVRGAWFNNSNFYFHLLDPGAKLVMNDPASPLLREGPYHGRRSEFAIANSYYATPEFWNRWTQRGASQFIPQKLSDVTFPARKGFLKQITVYDVPGYGDGYPTCCAQGVRSGVLWADLAFEKLAQAELLPGEPNFYHHGHPVPPAYWASGLPIDNTKDGIRGFDKP